MKHKLSILLSLVLTLCLFAGIGSVAYAADAEGGGSQNYPEFGNPTAPVTPSAPTYRVVVDDAQKDQIKPDRSSASAGTTVTIKVT